MRLLQLATTCALAATVALPMAVEAQEEEEAAPETRVITVSKFRVPAGEDRQKVMQFIDRVIAPQAQNNPHVLSYRVATHYYGSHASDIVIIAEYADWEAVEAPCGEPCQTWAEENIPEEGTPEREEFDELAEMWIKYYASGHSDEVYGANMSRAKL